MRHKGKTNPPGRQKIIKALSSLMDYKNFYAITTAEIAETAGVTEGLIYKYFKDKNDLLFQVLHLHFREFHKDVVQQLESCDSCMEKLETIIQASLESYAANRVFAKILLLEVRNSPSYFDSDAYDMVRVYSATILRIIEEGIESGELRPETDPYVLRKTLLGAIEHGCLGEVIFGRELDVDETTSAITHILFYGVKKI